MALKPRLIRSDIMVDYVILGGGIAGLYAAFRAAKKGAKVWVVEQAEEPGGLMRSRRYSLGHGGNVEFDYGIHYLLLTGVDAIDADLMQAVDKSEWRWFDDSLPEAHYYAGKLDQTTGCLDLTSHARHGTFFDEFMQADGGGDTEPTLAESVSADFGESILQEVFDPVCRKFTGLGPGEVAPEAFSVFANYRLKLVTDSKAAEEMKRAPETDRRLAYSRRKTGTSSIRKGYPVGRVGVGLFVQRMAELVKAEGVNILTGTTISDATLSKNGISRLRLTCDREQKTVECDTVVSTLAPALTARMFGVEFPSAPHRARTLGLHHFVFDHPPLLEESHWITVFETNMRTWRVTLYDNITGRRGGPYRVTVETVTDQMQVEENLTPRLIDELWQIGIVTNGVKPVASFTDACPRAVPVFLPQWKEAIAGQAEAVCSAVKNLVPVGLASGTSFGQIAALKSVYEAL